MTWVQFGLLAVLNFASVFVAIAVLRGIDRRQKKKAIEAFIDHVEEKISTEMNFQDLVKRFEEDEEGRK